MFYFVYIFLLSRSGPVLCSLNNYIRCFSLSIPQRHFLFNVSLNTSPYNPNALQKKKKTTCTLPSPLAIAIINLSQLSAHRSCLCPYPPSFLTLHLGDTCMSFFATSSALTSWFLYPCLPVKESVVIYVFQPLS